LHTYKTSCPRIAPIIAPVNLIIAPIIAIPSLLHQLLSEKEKQA
jgi:hypothetical protein